tara:strand:- start:11144 stop:12547 length:1404 start_codon:yes stop_codon:yes gene_type:complete
MNPFDQAWMLLLKEMLPPNYTQIGNEEKDLNAAERAWQMQYAKPNPVTAPQVDVSRPPVANLGENFFGPHSHERLTDRDRVVDEGEQQEVRDRISMAMGQFLDEYGLYKPGAPRNLAIRTHLLNEHRRPDETYSKSNGDSIVAVVRPHRRNNMKPELNTVMLRRSEMHHEAPQPFKAAAMSVDKVVNAHGMSKKQMKRLAAMRRQNRAIRTGEPMNIAMQLLKEDDYPRETYEEMFNESPTDIHPGHVSELGLEGDSSLSDESNRRANAYREAYIDGRYDPGEYGPWWQGLPERSETTGTKEGDVEFTSGHINAVERGINTGDLSVSDIALLRALGLGQYNELPIRVNQARIQDDEGPSFYGFPFNDATRFTRSEPMDIAMQLLKERKSPEAMRRKLEYDKKYEKTPERRKYQRELHAERRKRGIYGSGDHMDVSHTRGGKLTLEPEHSNRARHFKNQGTLRRVKVR